MNPITLPPSVILPAAPVTGSPVPHLTSIHSTPKRGPWGDWHYPGNCSGYIIKDLIQFFGAKSVLDPMTGSGTCMDVCKDLGVACRSGDLHGGGDACDPKAFAGIGAFDFVWLHPPYWRMKKYGLDPRCLSNAPTMSDFYLRLRQVIRNCKGVLAEGGKLTVLMGDYFDAREGKMVPCVQMTKEAALREGLWPACTDIIRFQHGNSSSHKTYARSFIPGLHDVCMVFERRK